MVVEDLGDALDMKDAESDGHSRLVTLYTIALATEMGIPREHIATIARRAFLHDIGKLAIPDSILRKPDQLTSHDASIMRKHPHRSYELVKRIPSFGAAAEIVYSHQERYDGTGYPRGLKGEEIPLGARIFAIADALDAITSPCHDRPARSLRVAREEIARYSGNHFDPEVVKVFLEMLDRIWEDLRRDIDGPTIN